MMVAAQGMSVAAPAFVPKASAAAFVPGGEPSVVPAAAAAHAQPSGASQGATPAPGGGKGSGGKGSGGKGRGGSKSKGGRGGGANGGRGGGANGGRGGGAHGGRGGGANGGRGGGRNAGRGRGGANAQDGKNKKKTKPKSHKSPSLTSAGSPQVSPSLFATTVSPGSGGRKGTNANHLLNFQLAERESGPADSRPVHMRPAHSRPRKMKKLGFLHSNSDVRFGIEPGEYDLQCRDGDRPLPWDSVQVVYLNSHDPNYRCPVCLEPPCCPKITQCGHVFCWTCVLQYLSYTSEPGRKCPMCNDFISGDDLKTVDVKEVKPVKAGATLDVVLLQRDRSTVFPQQFDATSATRGLSSTKSVPSVSDPAAPFSKFSVVDSMRPIFAKEREQLEAGQRIAVAESEHSMPFFEGALVQLEFAEKRSSARALPRPTGVAAPAAPEAALAKTSSSSDEDGPPAPSMWSSDDDEQTRKPEPALPAWGPSFNTPLDSPLHSTPEPEPPTAAEDSESKPVEDTDGSSHTGLKPAVEASGADNISYFYQSADGQPVFLHPLEMRCLQDNVGGVGGMDGTATLSVVECEKHIQDESTKKRFKFLSHLPEGSAFSIVEVNVKSIVSPETWSRFSDTLKQRDDKRRKQRKEQQRKDSQYSKKAAAAQIAANEQAPAYLSQVYTRRDESIFEEDEFFQVVEASAEDFEAEVAAVVADTRDDAGRPVKSFANITKKMGYFPGLSEQFPSLGGGGPDTAAADIAPPAAAAAATSTAAGGGVPHPIPPKQMMAAAGAWAAGGGGASQAKRADGVYSMADAAAAAEGGEEKVAPTLKEAWAEALLGKEPDPIPTQQGKGKKGKGKKGKGKQLLFATGQYR
jgi:hypothetical protein